MPELSKGTIVAIALIAVIATGVALRSMGFLSFYNLSVISNGPYYPWQVAKASNPNSMPGGDWQGGTEQSLVGGSGNAIRQFSDVLTYMESNYMVLKDFRATLATGVAVTGILARVNAQNSNCQDFGSTLVTAIGVSGPGARKTTDLCAGNIAPLGGEQDSWGMSLTGADIDNPNFGLWIYATSSAKNPNFFGHVTTVNVYSVSIMVYTSGSGGGGSPFTIALYLNPTSGKPTTVISGDVRTSPIQAGITMYLQVRRAGTTTWQDLYSVGTDVAGSLNTKWSPDQYGLVQDGNYFYRVRSEDGSVYSNELIFAQATSVIPPPPPGSGGVPGITDNWMNLLAIGLLISAVVVILVAVWHRRRS